MIYFFLISILCYIDMRYLVIPNIIVIPAIVLGVMLTGNWLMALTMFLIGVLLYNRKKFCGGDVKLLAMCGSFMGWLALPAFVLSRLIVHAYRLLRKYDGVLPYTPFLGLASVPFSFVTPGNILSQKWF